MSFNVREISVGVYECEILSTDIYSQECGLLLVSQTDATHYIIVVSLHPNSLKYSGISLKWSPLVQIKLFVSLRCPLYSLDH